MKFKTGIGEHCYVETVRKICFNIKICLCFSVKISQKTLSDLLLELLVILLLLAVWLIHHPRILPQVVQPGMIIL